MASLNKKGTKTTTFNGGQGFARDLKTELYLRSTTGFAGESKYYEKAEDADARAIQLARELAVGDWKWFSEFVTWLRNDGNIRTMSVMLAAEGVNARLAAKVRVGTDPDKPGQLLTSHRQLIGKVLQRPDEPGELISYWINSYGRKIPQPIKRGTADALQRMLNQRQALRYDKDGKAVRIGDVIDLVHPKTKNTVQGELYQYLITNRHNRDGYVPPASLTAINARKRLNALKPDERHDFALSVLAQDATAVAEWKEALAGQWEWGKSWLGAK
jgi:hypothetical protein